MRHDRDPRPRLTPGVTSLEQAAAILTADLPRLTDAGLARLLLEIRDLGEHPLGRLIEPPARAELRRRRITR